MNVIETFVYYDRPLLFLGEHEGARYVVVLADDAGGVDVWACAQVSPEEVDAFKGGRTDLRLLFSEPPERPALIVTVGDDGARYEVTGAGFLPEAYRPDRRMDDFPGGVDASN